MHVLQVAQCVLFKGRMLRQHSRLMPDTGELYRDQHPTCLEGNRSTLEEIYI